MPEHNHFVLFFPAVPIRSQFLIITNKSNKCFFIVSITNYFDNRTYLIDNEVKNRDHFPEQKQAFLFDKLFQLHYCL
jgi:hypothetical protein